MHSGNAWLNRSWHDHGCPAEVLLLAAAERDRLEEQAPVPRILSLTHQPMQARFGLRHTGIIRHVCCSIFDQRLTNNDVVFEGSCDCHLVPNPGWPDLVPCDGWRISDSCVHRACGSTDILVARHRFSRRPPRSTSNSEFSPELPYQSMLESFIAPSH